MNPIVVVVLHFDLFGIKKDGLNHKQEMVNVPRQCNQVVKVLRYKQNASVSQRHIIIGLR